MRHKQSERIYERLQNTLSRTSKYNYLNGDDIFGTDRAK